MTTSMRDLAPPMAGVGLAHRQAREQIITNMVRFGLPFSEACEIAGVPHSTGKYWMEEGRHHRGAYRRFATAVELARRERQADVDELVELARAELDRLEANARRARQYRERPPRRRSLAA